MCIKKRNSLKKVEWQLTGVCVCVCVFGGADSPHISSIPVSAPLDCLLSLLFLNSVTMRERSALLLSCVQLAFLFTRYYYYLSFFPIRCLTTRMTQLYRKTVVYR